MLPSLLVQFSNFGHVGMPLSTAIYEWKHGHKWAFLSLLLIGGGQAFACERLRKAENQFIRISGHTSAAFLSVGFLACKYFAYVRSDDRAEEKVKARDFKFLMISLVGSILVGLGRYLRKERPGKVVIGAVLGIGCGALATRLTLFFQERTNREG